MELSTDDVVAKRNSSELDGLSEVSFRGPDDTFFQMCRSSREWFRESGIEERGIIDIYSVINDQGQAAYGGITESVLTNTSFSIAFDEEASSALEDDRVNVEFKISPAELRGLREALNCIFRDTGVFRDKSDAV